MRIQLDLQIPMRDGARLAADLYRPRGDTPLPALLCRTIYDKQQPRYVEWALHFAEHGYAVVLADCRGRYASGGEWRPYVCETADGYDTHQWIGAQPWCNGRIGTFGISYVGFTQILSQGPGADCEPGGQFRTHLLRRRPAAAKCNPFCPHRRPGDAPYELSGDGSWRDLPSTPCQRRAGRRCRVRAVSTLPEPSNI